MVGALGRRALGITQGHPGPGVVTPMPRDSGERFPEVQKLDWHMELPMGATRKVVAEIWTLPLRACTDHVLSGVSTLTPALFPLRGEGGSSRRRNGSTGGWELVLAQGGIHDLFHPA